MTVQTQSKMQTKSAKLSEKIDLPSGVSCVVDERNMVFTKSGLSLTRHMIEPEINANVSGETITLTSQSHGKRGLKLLKSYVAHIKNIFSGLDSEFVYKLEMCNVHFPMTVKIEPKRLIINNFLGEKTPRYATILDGVKVEVKGTQITVTSRSRELAGQTAANMEKATKIANRDRRIFQDGIYITEKAGRKE